MMLLKMLHTFTPWQTQNSTQPLGFDGGIFVYFLVFFFLNDRLVIGLEGVPYPLKKTTSAVFWIS